MNRLSLVARPLLRISRVSPIQYRHIFTTQVCYNNPFGKLTSSPVQKKQSPDIKEKEEEGGTSPPPVVKNEEGEIDIDSITPENDAKLIEYYADKAKEEESKTKIESLIHPLKITLYNKVVKENGFFKNDQIVKHADKFLKFHLTPEEIEILEPTIFLESLRIKSSMKKATVVNRFVRGMNVKTAITQLHFNPKKMSTELEKLLKQGLEKAQKLGYNEDKIYIARLWTGSDGDWKKRIDIKGRGRHGIIQHKYIHLKCVIKTEQTKRRLDWEKAEKERLKKPRMFLNNEPLNIKVRPWYKW
ncbi:mrpl22 [Candida oxycetoniae]|uniref:Mrpl22 n=1 Tax=Candida oxycetoniae TaxID=497107 RepID=A0AAI9T027_9ASCO|nr:mrpl22 [Candida oxycetoniae]KAI3405535.1 mrpl22 [Candida oxycetoniae]